MRAKLAGYRLVARATGLFPAAALAGRAGSAARWVAWSRQRAEQRPVVWFHAASVGEALAAGPVIRRVRVARPDLGVVLTYTSPSLARWPGPLPVDRADFAPAETARAVGTVFDALAPAALVFSRSDLWPEMVVAAHARGVPVAVLGGTVRPGSRRLAWPARELARPLHHPIGFLGAVSAAHADRWARLGVPPGVIHVTGDPRHDSLLERIPRIAPLESLRSWGTRGPVIVAGSTEPSDDDIVLQAFSAVLRKVPDARLLVVPHDPAPARIRQLHRRARRIGLGCEDWAGESSPRGPAVIALIAGLLPDLYLMGRLAYVGGGFRPGRLHATLEPAVYGIPVLCGPETATVTDADELVRGGGAIALSRAEPRAELAAGWMTLLSDETLRMRMGMAARAVVQGGAAEATVKRLLPLLR